MTAWSAHGKIQVRNGVSPHARTHHPRFFGRDVYDRQYPPHRGARDEADAFLLGNQGPDPLFFAVLSSQLRAHNRLGWTVHNKKPSELLTALKHSLAILNNGEREAVGRAYALGFLCHYMLDSTMHPFVYFHEHRAVRRRRARPYARGRKRSARHHRKRTGRTRAVQQARDTVATFNPCADILNASDASCDAISKMHAYVALTVYGRIVPATCSSGP